MSKVKKESEERIDISSNEKIAFWCAKLNCTKESLVFAINIIGNSYKQVDDILILNRMKLKK